MPPNEKIMKKITGANLIWQCVTCIAVILPLCKAYPQEIAGTRIEATTFAENEQQLYSIKSSPVNISADLDLVRKRIVDDLMEPPVNATEIKKLITTINPDGSWPGINYKDTSRTGFQHREHLEHLLDLSRAFKKEGSEYFQDPAVKRTVSSALDFWIAHNFICENWWWNEMGTPNWMINTLLVLDTELTNKQRTEGARIASRASLTGFGARAGGDFVPIAGMVCKQALFKEDEAMLEHAIKVMTDQVIITNGRGINPDLGFHHRTDNVTSIHTYGTNYVSAFTYWTVKTAGTKFRLSEAAIKLLVDYYLDGICKAMSYRTYPDPGAKNRDLSRKGSLNAAGTDIPENFILSTDYRKKEMEALIQIRKGLQKNNLTWNKYYWHSSYTAHQRKKYFTSVRMHSSRQNNMEEPYNEEGLKMHHIADGSNFISRTGREYVDVFPVWDWQKIPGTTVVQRPELPPSKEIAKKGKSSFVGAVSDGNFGAAAFDFSSVHDPLTAHKSWFFFNNEYVCLGAGIHSTAEFPVATTLNQCLLNNEVVVKTNNVRQIIKKGEYQLTSASWIYHDGVGYIFTAPTSVSLDNKMATGNWREINHQDWATKDTVQRALFSLWLDHGIKPTNAGYAYIVVPGIEAASIDSYQKKSAISILANTTAMQAVQHKTLGISQVVFYKQGTLKLSDKIMISANSPCMVIVKLKGNSIEEMTVSDPTQKLTSLEISVNTKVEGIGNHWRSVWDKANKNSVIQIDLPTEGFAGDSVVLKF